MTCKSCLQRYRARCLSALVSLATLAAGAALPRAAYGQGSEPTCDGKTLIAWKTQARDPDPKLRADAAIALGKIGSAACVPALAELLKDGDPEVQVYAAALEDDISPRDKAAIPALAELLKDENERVRYSANTALRRMGREIVPALVELLKDRNVNVRRNAASVLGDSASEATAAIPALTEALKNGNEARQAAADALGNLGPKAATRGAGPYRFARRSRRTCSPGRRNGTGKNWTRSEEREAALTMLLTEGNAPVRLASCVALRKIDGEGKVTVPTLIGLLTDNDKDVRYSAAEELGRTGTLAKAAIPPLAELLNNEDPWVKLNSALAIARIDPETGIPIPRSPRTARE